MTKQTLWTFNANPEVKEAAAVIYHAPGRVPTSLLVALARWGQDDAVWVYIRSLGRQSETWRRFDTVDQMNAFVRDHHLVGVVSNNEHLRTVAEWRAAR